MDAINSESAWLARREGKALVFAGAPARLRWTFRGLAARDGYAIDAVIDCSAEVSSTAADRVAFAAAILQTGDSINAEQLAAHFSESARHALRQWLEVHDVQDAVSDDAQRLAGEFLLSKLKAEGFGVGVCFLPPLALRLQSPSLAAERARAALRARATAALQQESTLMAQFNAAKSASGGDSNGAVLERLPADLRGPTLTSLLRAASGRGETYSLIAVAGSDLVRFNVATPAATLESQLISAAAGPLRSVSLDGGSLLLGARSGVVSIALSGGGAADEYVIPDLPDSFEKGFNRVVRIGNSIFATHGALGLARWTIGQREGSIVQADSGARQLCAAGGESVAYLCDRGLVLAYDRGGGLLKFSANSALLSLLPDSGRTLLVHRDGSVEQLIDGELEVICQKSLALSSAALLPCAGETRLLIAHQAGGVTCVGLNDSLISEYSSSYRGFRALAAVEGLVAALPLDRQRIVFWNSWDGAEPCGDVFLAGRLRHRVADLLIVENDRTV